MYCFIYNIVYIDRCGFIGKGIMCWFCVDNDRVLIYYND